jgi:glycosyltransferase involved in cell wall biosynthesis
MNASSKRLYYLGKPADGYGWGIANTNLVRELSKLCELVVDNSGRTKFDAPVFCPITDHSLNPIRKVKRAPKTIGYCFTEWPLTDKAKVNSRQYDLIFCGSDWNTERLKAAGINHAETLHQGVEFNRFKPLPPCERNKFVVFSGGKYEFRKAQDVVIAAMIPFMKAHGDVFLLASWFNPWPKTMESMAHSWLVDHKEPFKGLDPERIMVLPSMPNDRMPDVYAQTHIGIFPNRCEAGTNLVMCEYMACSRPVIAADATGHKDVLNGDGPLKLATGSLDPAGWFNAPVADVLTHLEYAYSHKDELIERGQQCRKLIEPFTWEACAKKIYDAAFA